MSALSKKELHELYAFAVQLGKDAGAMLQQAANERIAGRARTKSVEKASSVDIVTETDEGMLEPCWVCASTSSIADILRNSFGQTWRNLSRGESTRHSLNTS